ncbi:hypothetical protein RHMOL_Rhmol02G0294200 [Rhododendron molle]|uniref:Uncharacterized protein n=1 Tax=Rhododendron molle TaxID=49168 RepID=A0ACC0PV79_RHOML|nr:hypothetical protein RHMOL_Rhmol02G0294200 [Rhododendron molle]
MNNTPINGAAASAAGESFRSRRPLPKRGQIKSRMAANAFHSIVTVLSRAHSHHHHGQKGPFHV